MGAEIISGFPVRNRSTDNTFYDITGISFIHALPSHGFGSIQDSFVMSPEQRSRRSRKRELNSQDYRPDIVQILGFQSRKKNVKKEYN